MSPARRLLSQTKRSFSPGTFSISNSGRELERSNDPWEPGNEPGELPSQSWGGSGRTAVPRGGIRPSVSHVQGEDVPVPPQLAVLLCKCCRALSCLPRGPQTREQRALPRRSAKGSLIPKRDQNANQDTVRLLERNGIPIAAFNSK